MINIVESHEKCTGCKACMKGCPMLDKFCDSPKTLLKELSESEKIDCKTPYSCMLCGYCTAVCPEGVDFNSIFLELRRDYVNKMGGNLPKELNTGPVDFHQKFSFSNIFTSDIQSLNSDTIFFPGCALISYDPKLVESIFTYLNEKVSGIGYYNKCCGKPTKFMGKEKDFQNYYSIIDDEFKKKNIKKIITGCQNCYMTIGENSSDIELVSLYEYLNEIDIPEGKKNIGKDIMEFSLHDPCPTRNVEEIHRSVRSLLGKMGIEFKEMKFNRRRTLCCGSGGMVPLTQNTIARSHMDRRASEATTDYIVTYCQECVESMRRGGKYSLHILDLLFKDDITDISQENQSTLTRWKNRFKGKKMKVKTYEKG